MFEATEVLARSALLDGLSKVQVQDVLALSSQVEHGDGDVVFAAGDPGEYVYLIEAGSVRIAAGPEADGDEIAQLGPGEVFGEMALLSDSPRSASAISVGACTLRRIDRDAFTALVESGDPAASQVLFNLAKTLCIRLRQKG